VSDLINRTLADQRGQLLRQEHCVLPMTFMLCCRPSPIAFGRSAFPQHEYGSERRPDRSTRPPALSSKKCKLGWPTNKLD
jgi:hypothetical protein